MLISTLDNYEESTINSIVESGANLDLGGVNLDLSDPYLTS